ncbi:MAG: PilZ domain-containing protein, partial [Bryobacteraceae bacterium]
MIPVPERRNRPRYSVSEVVEVYVAGADGRFIGCGVLRDICDTGAGIHIDVPIAPGTVVELCNEKGSLRAVCRHTKYAYVMYVSGFEFLDG